MAISLLDLILKVGAIEVEFLEARRVGLLEVGEMVEEESKAGVGHYQAAIRDVDAWAELADATKEDRVRRGYTENDPLDRSGKLKDSIGFTLVGDDGVSVGSDLPEAEFMENGTPTIPARSFLAGAAYRKEKEIVETLGEVVIKRIWK